MAWGYSRRKRQAYPKGEQGKVSGRGSSLSGVRRRRGQDKLPKEPKEVHAKADADVGLPLIKRHGGVEVDASS